MDAITKESPEWLAALALVPEKYAPNRRCSGMSLPTDWFSRCCVCNHEEVDGKLPEHNQPVPDISPDLLYAILEAGLNRWDEFVLDVYYKLGNLESPSLADAIIRAAASLQEAK